MAYFNNRGTTLVESGMRVGGRLIRASKMIMGPFNYLGSFCALEERHWYK